MSSRKKIASARPTKAYWMGWMARRRRSSKSRKAAKVRPMKRKSYLEVRAGWPAMRLRIQPRVLLRFREEPGFEVGRRRVRSRRAWTGRIRWPREETTDSLNGVTRRRSRSFWRSIGSAAEDDGLSAGDGARGPRRHEGGGLGATWRARAPALCLTHPSCRRRSGVIDGPRGSARGGAGLPSARRRSGGRRGRTRPGSPTGSACRRRSCGRWCGGRGWR